MIEHRDNVGGLLVMAAFALATAAAAPAGEGAFELHMRCGGPAEVYVASNGDVFEPDAPYAPRGHVGGRSVRMEHDWFGIEATLDPELHLDVREDFSEYRFDDVPAGWYLVTLRFVEFLRHGPDERVVDIVIEDQLVLTGLDLMAQVDRLRALPARFAVEVTDGTLNVATPPVRGTPALAAISIVSADPDGAAPAAPASPVAVGGFRRNIVSWTTGEEPDVAGYHVYRGPSPDGPFDRVNADLVLPARYWDIDVAVGATFFYRISAVDAWGNEGVLSEPVGAAAVDDDASRLPVYELLIEPEDLAFLYEDPWRGVTVPASLEGPGRAWPSVDVRLRGNTSLSLAKKNWRVEFPFHDPFDERGRDRVFIQSPRNDPSMLHDTLVFHLFRQVGVVAPLTSFMHLKVNGEFYGVQNDIERLGELFLERVGLDPEGDLFEANGPLELLPEAQRYVAIYGKRSNRGLGHGELIRFIEMVNLTTAAEFPVAARSFVDLPATLDYYAMASVVASADNVWHNYYLYRSPEDGRWRVVPWDHDLSLSVHLPIDLGMQGAGGRHNELVDALLRVEPFRAYYCDRIAAYLADVLTPEIMSPLVEATHDLVAFDARRDVRKRGGRENNGAFDASALDLQDWVVAQAEWLAAEMDGFCDDDAGPFLFINEFMAVNGATIADEWGDFDGWIEIYNADVVDQDLAGMHLTNDLADPTRWRIPDGVTVAAGERVLFWADDQPEQGDRHAGFVLPVKGGEIGLADRNGSVIDAVEFGAQVEDVSWWRYPDASDTWGPSAEPTPAAVNFVLDRWPTITGTAHFPAEPDATDDVLVTTTVEAASPIDSVKLVWYHDDTARVPLAMRDDGLSGDGDAGDGVYGATIPAEFRLVEISYFIEAVAASGFSARDPAGAAAVRYTYDLAGGRPPLAVNELMAENETTIQDEFGEHDDWFEVYNVSFHDVDMSGMYLTDDLADRTMWRVPDGVVVPARGWLVFWADGQPEQGDTHTNFTLSRNGDQVGIFRTDDDDNGLVDAVTFGLQQADISYGRETDGSKQFVFFDDPTPGAPNGGARPADISADGRVGFEDLLTVLSEWGACPPEGECPADLDGSGTVDFTDLLEILAAWGPCP